ncbi:MAG: helix-turn-helix domain-containing protein [Lachnospiraceae bacterium]
MKHNLVPIHDTTKPMFLHCAHSEISTFPAHFHVNVEIIYMLEGTMEFVINNMTYVLNAGDIAMVFPHLVHAVHTPVYSRTYLMMFYPEILPDFHIKLMENHPINPVIRSDEVSTELKETIYKLFEYVRKVAKTIHSNGLFHYSFDKTEEQRFVKAYFQLIMCHIFKDIEMISNENIQNDRVLDCIQYITNHFQLPISVEDVAHELGISKIQVSRIFSTKIGCSFTEYVNSLRLNNAYQLLEKTEKSILEVCEESGFSAISTFYNAFQKKYHISPRKLRMKLKESE